MKPDNPIRNLDPRKLAYYEKENYVAYYQKDWLKLLRVSVGMVKEAFGLSWPQAIYGAYLMPGLKLHLPLSRITIFPSLKLM